MRLGPSRRHRFWRAEGGATAPEFAIVALPFFFLLFAIVEMGLIFVVDAMLDDAVIETGRLVRTGQAAERGMTQEQFLDEVCDRMVIMEESCRADGNTEVDVRVVTQFDAPITDPAADGRFEAGETGYTSGAPGQLMLVRVWYHHPVITAYLAPGAGPGPNAKMIMASSTAFRNEPAG